MSRCNQTKRPFDPRFNRRTAFLQHTLTDEPRRFGHLNIVQQRQRLKRRARALAFGKADISLGGVERDHAWRWNRPFPKSIKAASMQVVTMSLLIFWIAHRNLPKSRGLIRLNAWSADFFGQQSTISQRLV